MKRPLAYITAPWKNDAESMLLPLAMLLIYPCEWPRP